LKDLYEKGKKKTVSLFLAVSPQCGGIGHSLPLEEGKRGGGESREYYGKLEGPRETFSASGKEMGGGGKPSPNYSKRKRKKGASFHLNG